MKEIAKDEEKQKQKDKMTEERSQEVKTYEMIFLLYFDSSLNFGLNMMCISVLCTGLVQELVKFYENLIW